MATICVAGAWHQASVVGPCLAALGHTVRGVGLEQEAIEALGAGRPPVHEPGLRELLAEQLANGRLRYTTSFGEALAGAEFVMVALDTPVGPDDAPDLAPVFAVVRAIAAAAQSDVVLVVSSQVPVGTCDRLLAAARDASPAREWMIAYVPEFLRLGSAVDLFLHPDRIVIGADDHAVGDRVATLYSRIEAPIVRTGLRTAEMVKHASNAFLAASVSFVNEIAGLCEETGADALQVAAAMKLDRRVGRHAFLSPGLGFAGGTLGRDVRALQTLGREHGRPTRVLDAIVDVNRDQTRLAVDRLKGLFPSLEGVSIALLGLTYKPGTSTLRRSVALETAIDLLTAGANVVAHDPQVPPSRASELPVGLRVVPTPYDALVDARVCVLMTEWPEYGELDWARAAATMAEPLLIDARNALDPDSIVSSGLRYWGVGRGARPR